MSSDISNNSYERPSNTSDKESIDLEQAGLNWNHSIDTLLSKWSDHAKCFYWMHTESFDLNYRRARLFMIIIYFLTTVSGFSNIITGSYTVNGFQIAWVFGGITIFISFLQVLQDKLGYQHMADTHRKAAGMWFNVQNKIEEIITLPYVSRVDCKTFMKYIKGEINQAMQEKNFMIPKQIRDACYSKFNTIPEFDIPDICGQIEHTKVYINA